MKEDILEQLVEDYLNLTGYFTKSNIKYRPEPGCAGYDSKQDSVYSDIDILAVNPTLTGPNRVIAATCKSYQSGFWPKWEIEHMDKVVSGREGWRRYRELWVPKWGSAFSAKVTDLTGSQEFTHLTAVTVIGAKDGNKKNGAPSTEPWCDCSQFRKSMPMAVFKVIDMATMISAVVDSMTTTVANSPLSRTIQLMVASGFDFSTYGEQRSWDE